MKDRSETVTGPQGQPPRRLTMCITTFPGSASLSARVTVMRNAAGVLHWNGEQILNWYRKGKAPAATRRRRPK